MYENYLAHYGVLGMKWGVRRYQPYSVRGRDSGKDGIEIGEAKKASRAKKAAKIAGATAGIGAASYAVGRGINKLDYDKQKELVDELFSKKIKTGKDKPNISSAEVLTKDAGTIIRFFNKTKKSGERPVKNMSEDELKRRISRLELEKRYEDLSSEDIRRGRISTNDILDVIGSVVQIAGTTYLIYKKIK